MDALLFNKIVEDLKVGAGGKLSLPPAVAARLVTGCSRETTSRQLTAGTFPLPVVKAGKKWVVSIYALAQFLIGGNQTSAALPSSTEKRSSGRPAQYSAKARASAAKAKAERAVARKAKGTAA